MTANVLNVWGEIIGVVVGGVILLIFSVFFSLHRRWTGTLPGEAGRRTTPGQQEAHDVSQEAGGRGEVVKADGYIDSFAGLVEESGGGLPPLIKISAIGIPLWWFIYLITNWSQYILSMRSFNR